MQQALMRAAKAADQDEVPVGAIVVVNDEIVAEGWNQPISSNDPTAHAEMVALRSAAKKLKNYRLIDATLYVTIEPCTMCAGALIHSRVSRVVYGAAEPKSGVVESNPCVFDASYVNHQIDYCGGVLADQCSAIMSAFFKRRRQEKKAQ
jgi:tRNA(adenine34) deaminase